MITNVQECIKPISYVKTNAADMMNFVNDKKEPLIITQNGESRAVLIDVESYQEMKDAFNLLKIIQFSEMDVRAGRTKPATEVFSTGGRYGGGAPAGRGSGKRRRRLERGEGFPLLYNNLCSEEE